MLRQHAESNQVTIQLSTNGVQHSDLQLLAAGDYSDQSAMWGCTSKWKEHKHETRGITCLLLFN
jgi:hypothetical protein